MTGSTTSDMLTDFIKLCDTVGSSTDDAGLDKGAAKSKVYDCFVDLMNEHAAEVTEFCKFFGPGANQGHGWEPSIHSPLCSSCDFLFLETRVRT